MQRAYSPNFIFYAIILLIVSHFSFVEQVVSFELRDQNLSDSAQQLAELRDQNFSDFAQQLAELRDQMDRRNHADAYVAAVGEKHVVDHEALARAAKHLD